MGAEDEKTTKTGKAKQATAETLTTIAYDCDDVLAFLKSAAVKSPRVIVAPIYLHADKRTRVWFRCWTDVNLPHAAQAGSTRPHGSHGRPDRRD